MPGDSTPARPAVPVLSVAEVAGAIRELLESSFPLLRVEGEVSNLSRPQSGHVYFSLVEERGGGSRLHSAQLPCVVWRSSAQRLRHRFENGDRVIASGRIGVYEPRGTYQLIAQKVEPLGQGNLQARFEELKEKLRLEGLFETERKRPIPSHPSCIAVVTSISGAAVQDVLRSILLRNDRAWVRLVPARVQGEGAAVEISTAIDRLSESGECDVIVLARGGGSIEDLWAFNEEVVARAIARSRIPVVSAVGHEVDFTISDFVADARAQTPTQVGELVCPDRTALLEGLDTFEGRLRRALLRTVRRAEEDVHRLSQRRVLRSPEALVERLIERCDDASEAMQFHLYNRLGRWEDTVAAVSARLDALSPLKVLARGYSLTTTATDAVVTDAASLQPGQQLRIRFASGSATAETLEVAGVETPPAKSSRVRRETETDSSRP